MLRPYILCRVITIRITIMTIMTYILRLHPAASSAALENLPARFVQASGRMALARVGDPNVEAHQERLDREAHKLWLRMRREAARELLDQQQLREPSGPPGTPP